MMMKKHSMLSQLRRLLITGMVALPVALAMSSHVLATPPTDEVNTTGLAVTDDTVNVGILHSLTGTMAISETGSVEAEQLAIEQINAQGGVLGRQIVPIIEDGASDWPTFADRTRKLLTQDNVPAIFGAWTSASRKAMLPVLERENGLLYYPTFYEGLEESPNVIVPGRRLLSRYWQASTGHGMNKEHERSILLGRIIFGRVPQ